MRRLILLVIALKSSPAQVPDEPGKLCCGRYWTFQGNLRGSAVSGTVVDPTGAAVSGARVQVEVEGHAKILREIHANDKGQCHLRGLPQGHYWLGISAPGFELDYWRLTIWPAGEVRIRAALTVGT
jgi:hypothetical protein